MWNLWSSSWNHVISTCESLALYACHSFWLLFFLFWGTSIYLGLFRPYLGPHSRRLICLTGDLLMKKFLGAPIFFIFFLIAAWLAVYNTALGHYSMILTKFGFVTSNVEWRAFWIMTVLIRNCCHISATVAIPQARVTSEDREGQSVCPDVLLACCSAALACVFNLWIPFLSRLRLVFRYWSLVVPWSWVWCGRYLIRMSIPLRVSEICFFGFLSLWPPGFS